MASVKHEPGVRKYPFLSNYYTLYNGEAVIVLTTCPRDCRHMLNFGTGKVSSTYCLLNLLHRSTLRVESLRSGSYINHILREVGTKFYQKISATARTTKTLETTKQIDSAPRLRHENQNSCHSSNKPAPPALDSKSRVAGRGFLDGIDMLLASHRPTWEEGRHDTKFNIRVAVNCSKTIKSDVASFLISA